VLVGLGASVGFAAVFVCLGVLVCVVVASGVMVILISATTTVGLVEREELDNMLNIRQPMQKTTKTAAPSMPIIVHSLLVIEILYSTTYDLTASLEFKRHDAERHSPTQRRTNRKHLPIVRRPAVVVVCVFAGAHRIEFLYQLQSEQNVYTTCHGCSY
jgi:hypothetical protein